MTRERGGARGTQAGSTGRGPERKAAGVPRPAWTGRIDPWALAALLAGIALAATFDPRLYINGDNIDYMFLARSLRAGHLWPSDKYPPLFPLLLAPVQSLAGMRLIPQKILVLLFGLGSVLLLRSILRRRIASPAGPWVLWVAATLIPVVEYAHYVMSEIPYLFFLLGAVDACDRLLEGRADARTRSAERGAADAGTAAPDRGAAAEPDAGGLLRTAGACLRGRGIWILALWIAAAFYTRSAGAGLAVGIALAFLIKRRAGMAVALAAALVPFALPWLIRSLATPGGNPYFRQLILVNPYYPQFGTLTAASLLRRLTENGVFYFVREIPSTVFPIIYHSTYTPPGYAFLPAWLAVLLLVPLAIGLWRGLRDGDPATAVVVATLVLCCLWPLIWTGSRFIVPIVPLLLFVWWRGWFLESPRRVWVRRVLLALLVLLSVRNLFFYTEEKRAYPPEWENYFRALHWVAASTPADAIVADRKPGFVEFVAKRPAVAFPRESDPDRMLAFLRERRVRYVVLSSLPYDDIARYLQPALDKRRSFFDIVDFVPDPNTFVLEFHPEGGAGLDRTRPGAPPIPPAGARGGR